jgi:hypothetical protein
MPLKSEVDQLFLAAVESGNIRYQSWPTAGKAIADDGAYDEIVAAGAGPGAAVPCWLCGFSFSIATGLITAEVGFEFTIGYGGAAGDGNAPTVVLITNWAVNFSAVALALGPFNIPRQTLPYPIKIPAGVAIEACYTTLVGASAITSFRVMLATAVGS